MTIDTLNYIDGERDYSEWKHRKTHGLKGGLDMNIYLYISKSIVAFIVHISSCKTKKNRSFFLIDIVVCLLF